MATSSKFNYCGNCSKFIAAPAIADLGPLNGVCARRVEHDNLLIIKTAPRPVPSDELAELARCWVTDVYMTCPYHTRRDDV